MQITLRQAKRQLREAGLAMREVRANAVRGSATLLRITKANGSSYMLPVSSDRTVDGSVICSLVAA